MPTTDSVRDTVEELATVARRVHSNRDRIQRHRESLLVVAEVVGLLDVVCGLALTNPEDRARGHIDMIQRLLADSEQVLDNQA